MVFFLSAKHQKWTTTRAGVYKPSASEPSSIRSPAVPSRPLDRFKQLQLLYLARNDPQAKQALREFLRLNTQLSDAFRRASIDVLRQRDPARVVERVSQAYDAIGEFVDRNTGNAVLSNEAEIRRSVERLGEQIAELRRSRDSETIAIQQLHADLARSAKQEHADDRAVDMKDFVEQAKAVATQNAQNYDRLTAVMHTLGEDLRKSAASGDLTRLSEQVSEVKAAASRERRERGTLSNSCPASSGITT